MPLDDNMRPKGRPKKYAEFDRFYAGLPAPMRKRPQYHRGIGIFRGEKFDTAWIKVTLRHATVFRGKPCAAGRAIELKLGRLASFTWDQLVRAHADYQGKADRGEPLEALAPPTFEMIASAWLTRAKVRLRGPKTAEIHIRKHLGPSFGRQAITEISTASINDWIATRLRAGAKPGTVKRELATLSSILGNAVRTGVIAANPCDRLERLQSDPPRQHFLTASELKRLVHAADDHRHPFLQLVRWLIVSGMRRGEALRLRWSNIRSDQDGQVFVELERTKSGRPRLIAANNTMIRILDEIPRDQPAKEDLIFKISLSSIKRHWNALRISSGLRSKTMHDLRRTYATYAVSAGIDVRTVSEQLGHADLKMLQGIYAVVSDKSQKAAASRMDELFRPILDDMPKAMPAAPSD